MMICRINSKVDFAVEALSNPGSGENFDKASFSAWPSA